MKIGTVNINNCKIGSSQVNEVRIGSTLVWQFSSLDPDAQAFITAAGITNPTQQTAINTLVLSLKSNGLWAKMKAIYPFVGGTASSHSYNLKNIAQFQMSWNGGVTHNVNGITGNGINSFGNTGVLDSSLNVNDKHLSIYQRNILSTTSGSSMGINNQNRFYLNFSGQNYSTLSNNQSPYAVVSPQNGFMALSKISATPTIYKYYQNALTPTSRTSSNISNLGTHFVLACYNPITLTGFDYSLANLAFASLGDGLTDTDYTNLRTAVQIFQTTLGRNV
jgi:hypothetical protein